MYFNHTTIFVTSETYDAFKSSPLLNDEFSASAEHTVQAEGGARSYTGIYISGAQTYLELFKTGLSSIAKVIVPPGRIQVGMSIDHRTQLPLIRDRVSGVEIRLSRNAQNEPRFDLLRPDVDMTKVGVHTWILATYPDGKTRNRPSYATDRLLHNVAAYTVTVGAGDREELLKWFRAYGYTIREDGEKRIAMGPDFTFTMLPEPADGVRTAVIEMSLNREKTGEQTYKIGDSELKFNKDRATLTFRFPKTTDR